MSASPDLLIDQSPDAIIFAGTDGLISTWNPAAERIFGHAATAAIGQSLDIIIPEQFRDAHWKGYDTALEAKATKYAGKALATRAVRADGATIYVELSFAVIQDESGTVLGALAHARDITERFEADRETRRRLRELEAAAKT
ncbi:MAG: PAS domain S-box protein [Tepidiformaceae bacterium]